MAGRLTLQKLGDKAKVGYWGLGLLLTASWLALIYIEGFTSPARDIGLPILFLTAHWGGKLLEASYISMAWSLATEVADASLAKVRFVGGYEWWAGLTLLAGYHVWKLLTTPAWLGLAAIPILKGAIWFLFLLAVLDLYIAPIGIITSTPRLSRLAFKFEGEQYVGLRPVGRYVSASLILYVTVSAVWTGIGGGVPNPNLAEVVAPWIIGVAIFPPAFYSALSLMARERMEALERASRMKEAALNSIWRGLDIRWGEARVLKLYWQLSERQGESVLDLLRDAYCELGLNVKRQGSGFKAAVKRVMKRVLAALLTFTVSVRGPMGRLKGVLSSLRRGVASLPKSGKVLSRKRLPKWGRA